MLSLLRPSIVLFALLTLLTGLIYPLAVTGIAQAAFPHQANGSLLPGSLLPRQGQKDSSLSIVGSELIGQQFSDPRYFWGRPSATSPYPYNAAASSGSNLGPTNPALLDAARARIAALRAADRGAADRGAADRGAADPANKDRPLSTAPLPVDLVTASASGLDPDISVAAALYQVPRIARLRGLSQDQLLTLVARFTKGRQFGLLGEPRLNVLELNLALDNLK